MEKVCADILADGRRALGERGTLVQRLVAFLDAWKGKPSRLMASSPHTAEIIESTATVHVAITASFYEQMRAMLADALHKAGIGTTTPSQCCMRPRSGHWKPAISARSPTERALRLSWKHYGRLARKGRSLIASRTSKLRLRNFGTLLRSTAPRTSLLQRRDFFSTGNPESDAFRDEGGLQAKSMQNCRRARWHRRNTFERLGSRPGG